MLSPWLEQAARPWWDNFEYQKWNSQNSTGSTLYPPGSGRVTQIEKKNFTSPRTPVGTGLGQSSIVSAGWEAVDAESWEYKCRIGNKVLHVPASPSTPVGTGLCHRSESILSGWPEAVDIKSWEYRSRKFKGCTCAIPKMNIMYWVLVCIDTGLSVLLDGVSYHCGSAETIYSKIKQTILKLRLGSESEWMHLRRIWGPSSLKGQQRRPGLRHVRAEIYIIRLNKKH